MPQKSDSNESAFKNWINADVVRRLAIHIQSHYPDFPSKEFQKVSSALGPLELKARVQKIREALKANLPASYAKALKILLKATLKPSSKAEALKGFALWPVTDFIQTYGLQDIEISLDAQAELTSLFTAEFSIRPFLNQHPDKTYKFLLKATLNPNDHIRRWASEGSRPRLPWGEQIKSAIHDPRSGIQILEQLKYDDSEYVRKSVANHLNDISKDHPDLALKLAKKWMKEVPSEEKSKIQWIVRNGLRTLLKKGNATALQLFGYSGQVQIQRLKIKNPKVKIGESFEFEFTLKAKDKTKVMVDYIVHHQKANGKTSPKVFKLTVKELKAGETLVITKKHSFKIVTTRVYYPGPHILEIMVNGYRLGQMVFQLR